MAARLCITAIMATWAATRWYSSVSSGGKVRGTTSSSRDVSASRLGKNSQGLSAHDLGLKDLLSVVIKADKDQQQSPAILYDSGTVWYAAAASPLSRGFLDRRLSRHDLPKQHQSATSIQSYGSTHPGSSPSSSGFLPDNTWVDCAQPGRKQAFELKTNVDQLQTSFIRTADMAAACRVAKQGGSGEPGPPMSTPASVPVAVNPLAALGDSLHRSNAAIPDSVLWDNEQESGLHERHDNATATPRGSSRAAHMAQWVFGSPDAETMSCLQDVKAKYKCDAIGCDDQVQGFVNYLATHECTLGGASLQWISWVFMITWLLYLLYFLGDTADEFFCPVLDQIVIVTHMSPNLAGVTFLSLGNGAPDAAASIAATLSGQLDVGVSAVLGAGVFVTTVVIAIVILQGEVTLNRRPFLRDTIFCLVCTLYLLVCFADQKVRLGEALGFLGIYIVFGAVVVIGRQVYQGSKQHADGGLEAPAMARLAGEGEVGVGDQTKAAAPWQATVAGLLVPLEASGAAAPRGPARSRALSDEWMASERKTEVVARLHQAVEDRTLGRGHDARLDSSTGSMRVGTRSPLLAQDSLLGEAEMQIAGAGAFADDPATNATDRTPDAATRIRSGSMVERGDGSNVHGAVSSAMFGHHEAPRAHLASHGSDGYHGPEGYFRAHGRRARMWMRFIVDRDSGAIEYSRQARSRIAQRRSERPAAASVNLELSKNPPSSHTGAPLLPAAAPVESLAQDKADIDENEGFCNVICGEDTVLGKVLFVILFPSNLLRQITVPLLDEDNYDYRFVALTSLFGLPFMAAVSFQTVGVHLHRLVEPILPGAPAGLCMLLVLGLTGLTKSVVMFFTLPRKEVPQSAWVVVPLLIFGFLTSVSWIILVANEIVGLLEVLGLLLKVPTSVLGLTVLAWGNSLGDLIADMTVAKEGKPDMAIAGAIAGPAFNVVVGLGLSLIIGVTDRMAQHAEDPSIKPYIDLTNPDNTTPLPQAQIRVVWTLFGFFILSLISLLLVVPLSSDSSSGKYTMPKWFAWYQLGCYAAFMVLACTFTFVEF